MNFHSTALQIGLLTGLCLFGTATAASDAQPPNRIWFLWEQTAVDANLCADREHCTPVRRFLPRLVDTPSTKQANEMLGAMDRMIVARGDGVEHPQAPRICENTEAQTILGFDPEAWELSDSDDALKGLVGVHFAVDQLTAPAAYDGDFGKAMQATMRKRFSNAGIPYLTKEEMNLIPGKPMLNIYFSNTDPDSGCHFSIYASMSQTALLTRNHTVKLRVGTWGMSGGYSNDHPGRSEFDAILVVVDKFIADYQRANPERGPMMSKAKYIHH